MSIFKNDEARENRARAQKAAAKEKSDRDGLTELVFILDRSGSMSGLEGDTVGGFNAMIEKQKREGGECLVSTLLFDHEQVVLHDRIPLSEVAPLTEEDYVTRGSTALFDAVGSAIHHIGTIHKYARPEDVPAHTLFLITTDGMENASRRYNGEGIKEMIERQKSRYGWEFLFIGANVDAILTARIMGISSDHAVNYCADSKGTRLNYEAMNKAVYRMRTEGCVAADWKSEVEEDHKKRGC